MSIALRSGITVIGSAVMLVVTNPKLGVSRADRHPVDRSADRAVGPRRARCVARQPGPRRRRQCPGQRKLRRHAYGAELRARSRRARTLRFGHRVRRGRRARKRIRMQSLLTAIAIMLVFGAITLVLWSGAHDVVAGPHDRRHAGPVRAVRLIGAGSVGALAEVWNGSATRRRWHGRISELLANRRRSAALPPPAARHCTAPVRGEIDVQTDVSFHYPSREELPRLRTSP